jgi:L-alanine-DL-glutamate epimerase-like enolase superfamily enzyme
MTLDTRVLPLVLGRNANEIGRIKQELEFRLHNFGRVGPIVYAISAVDIACGTSPARPRGCL